MTQGYQAPPRRKHLMYMFGRPDSANHRLASLAGQVWPAKIHLYDAGVPSPPKAQNLMYSKRFVRANNLITTNGVNKRRNKKRFLTCVAKLALACRVRCDFRFSYNIKPCLLHDFQIIMLDQLLVQGFSYDLTTMLVA